MKKIIYMCMAVVLAFAGLTACSSNTQKTDENQLKVVTTIFPQYDFVRNIGGDKVDITMLLKPGAESHSYEPTPQDIKDIQACDLFIYVGGENDVWVEDILTSMEGEKPETLRLMDIVSTVEEEVVEGMEEEEHEHEGEEEAEMDEHVWTSPKNAIAIVNAIAKSMEEKSPENAQIYTERSEAYAKELEVLDEMFRDVVSRAQRKTLVFGDRFPFRYLSEEYGLSYYAAFSGCSTDTEASASTIAFLIDKVKSEQIPVVFTIEFSNGKIADTICESTGAEKLSLYSCHNVTKQQMEDGVSYLSMMTENVESLRKALVE